MKIIYLLILLIISSIISVPAQITCPAVAVFGPDSVIEAGQIMTFEARISEKEKADSFKYNWSVDKGTIITGQGTKLIQVSTEGLSDTTITAAVEIEILNGFCESLDAETGVVGQRLEIDPYDRYEKISWEDELARFDSFLIAVQQNSESRGYVLITTGQGQSLSSIKKHIQKLIKHLKHRKISPDRIIFAIEKFENRSTTLITVPIGAELPKCEDCEIIKGSDFK